MEQFDEKLKNMAKQEEWIMPEGFDGRLQNVLENLPPRAVRRGLGAAKTVLIAAAACVLLMGTALAASPGMREMLSAALGGFAPYAQEQDGQAYEMDGLEVRVLSAMADQDTVRVYVQFKDLEGDRLSEHINGMGLVDVPAPPPTDASGIMRSWTFGAQCLSYDAEAKTALMVYTSWGRIHEDLSDAQLILSHVYDTQTLEDISVGTTLHIPLNIEVMPSTTLDKDTELAAGFFAESMRLSPLGITAVTYGNTQYTYLAGSHLRLTVKDGTEILSCGDHVDGQGSYGEYGTESSRRVLTWNFRDPLEVEQIQSVTIIDRDGGERTFPVELP